MLFNSYEFLAFFAVFCVVYRLARRNATHRNLAIIAGSYIFYGAWDYRFAFLLFGTSLLDFALARGIEGAPANARRRALLITSISLNLGVLFFFKYFNFFIESLESLMSGIGWNAAAHWKAWNVVLPVGISFYTFQSMGYVIDVYRRALPATRDFIQYQSFVAFFPQLVAGPIERGRHMLPQFLRPARVTIEEFESGLWLVIWGMFKKVVVADNLAPMVSLAYEHSKLSGPAVMLGTVAFAVQIYCDFSGYSDIARGLARWLGFELMINFNRPYFAASLREFWRRWHISLSTWLRDYLYFSLGGSRRGEARTYLNIALTMLLCGLWHGASLTFLLWGSWHGLGLMANRFWDRRMAAVASVPKPLAWLITMLFVLYGWMLFRAESVDRILEMNRSLLDYSLPGWFGPYLANFLILVIPLVAVEVAQAWTGIVNMPLVRSRWPRAIMQGAMLVLVIVFWQIEPPPFIYFQF